MQENLVEQKMKMISINAGYDAIKNVQIMFIHAVDTSNEDDVDENIKTTEYPVKSTHVPHKDFTSAMRALTEHALKICEIDIIESTKTDYVVLAIKVSGDLFMNEARVQLILGKRVHRSKKMMKWPASPQITLSDKSNYLEWKDLKKKIEKAFQEAWLYLMGKHHDDRIALSLQLKLDLQVPPMEGQEEEKKSPHRRERAKKEKKQEPAKEEAPIIQEEIIAPKEPSMRVSASA